MRAKGGLERAVALYTKALTIDPSMVDTRSNLGVAYIFQRQYANAVRELTGALALQPDHVGARQNLALGEAALARGHLPK